MKRFFEAGPAKTVLALLLAALTLFAFTGCGRYASGYKAVGFVHSNETKSAFMSFYTFEGRMVFKLKSDGEGDIVYTAKLGSGSAKVYYDYAGTKAELTAVGGGDEIDARGGYVEAGAVYIIVETDGECVNGEFTFRLDEGGY